MVELTWTPTATAGHVCFQVEVWGKLMKRASSDAPWFPIGRAYAASPPPKDEAGRQLLERRQHNIGPVVPKCEPQPKKRCDTLADAEKTVGKMIKSHMSSAPDSKSIGTWKRQLDSQLKGASELLCDNNSAQKKVDELRQRLESFDPGQAKGRPEVVAQGRTLGGIEVDLEQLSEKWCAVPRPSPPPKKPPVVKQDDPCLRDTKDLLQPKEGLEFLWWWIQEVVLPDPSPPGFDPLDPCLGPQGRDGWFETQKQLKARDALQNGRFNEYERIRKMSIEEFHKEYVPF
jgi:hypothetical protein